MIVQATTVFEASFSSSANRSWHQTLEFNAIPLFVIADPIALDIGTLKFRLLVAAPRAIRKRISLQVGSSNLGDSTANIQKISDSASIQTLKLSDKYPDTTETIKTISSVAADVANEYRVLNHFVFMSGDDYHPTLKPLQEYSTLVSQNSGSFVTLTTDTTSDTKFQLQASFSNSGRSGMVLDFDDSTLELADTDSSIQLNEESSAIINSASASITTANNKTIDLNFKSSGNSILCNTAISGEVNFYCEPYFTEYLVTIDSSASDVYVVFGLQKDAFSDLSTSVAQCQRFSDTLDLDLENFEGATLAIANLEIPTSAPEKHTELRPYHILTFYDVSTGEALAGVRVTVSYFDYDGTGASIRTFYSDSNGYVIYPYDNFRTRKKPKSSDLLAPILGPPAIVSLSKSGYRFGTELGSN